MATSKTTVVEPQQIPMTELELQPIPAGNHASPSAEEPPTDAVEREPATPFFKLGVAGFSFFCAGVNDGTLGPLIPYMLSTFHIGTGEIAIM
jgi:hypothetical protein